MIFSLSSSIRTSSVHIRALAVLLICASGTGLYLFATHQSDKTFDTDYAAYAALATAADNAAYLPGAQDNPVRVALDQDLTQALDQSTAPSARLAVAARGLSDLNASKAQIDDISSSTAAVDVAVAKMQVDTLDNIAPSGKARSIIALAKSRSSIVSDIRAYSYRTDLEISQIFSTIISDKGLLLNAYVIELNNEIPTVETEFDKRSALYTELENTAQEIADVYAGTPVPTTAAQGQ